MVCLLCRRTYSATYVCIQLVILGSDFRNSFQIQFRAIVAIMVRDIRNSENFEMKKTVLVIFNVLLEHFAHFNNVYLDPSVANDEIDVLINKIALSQ